MEFAFNKNIICFWRIDNGMDSEIFCIEIVIVLFKMYNGNLILV